MLIIAPTPEKPRNTTTKNQETQEKYTAKKYAGGTNLQTDIATYRLNRPIDRFTGKIMALISLPAITLVQDLVISKFVTLVDNWVM